jgi:hypothetical protein
MFGGDMSQWLIFANTLKLKVLMNLTQTSDGPAFIQSELSGLTPADFIGADQDATINPGYANDANNHQSPLWQDIGSNTTGTAQGNNNYFRATSYAVAFYQNTGDPRVGEFYSPTTSGNIAGRQFGSTALEHNSDISGIGGPSKGKTPTTEGVLKSPSQPALIISASESLFLQAEAAERGYLSGATSSDLFKAAVTESFKYLEANYDPIRTADNTADSITFTPETSAERFYSQANDKVNIDISTDKIRTIILQKWAALNTIDALAAWDDWRRLGIPSDLPVSIYPGTTATHVPYRLPYPTSEYNYNAANTNQQGTIDPLSSKIFWMP